MTPSFLRPFILMTTGSGNLTDSDEDIGSPPARELSVEVGYLVRSDMAPHAVEAVVVDDAQQFHDDAADAAVLGEI
jgi:hypothetical protein